MSASESESRFEGAGQEFHAKYMGSVEVAKSKGQEICQEAMQKLLMILKTRKEPKPRLIINLSFEGTRLKEMPPGFNLLDLTFKHSQVSYVWKDPRDQRSLGIVCAELDPEDASRIVYQFHGIRTVKPAMPFLQEMQELFRIVKERSAQLKEERAASVSAGEAPEGSTTPQADPQQTAQQPVEQPQESRDRAVSNLLGPDLPTVGSNLPKNESIASLDDLGDIFSASATVSQPVSSGNNFNSGSAFNPFGQLPTTSSSNPFGQQPQQPPAMMPTVPTTSLPYSGYNSMPPYQQQFSQPNYNTQSQFAAGPQLAQPQFVQPQFAQPQFAQPQFAQPRFNMPQQQPFGAPQYNPYQQQQSMGAPVMSTNPFATGPSLFDRQNSAPSGINGEDLLTPVSLNPTAATTKASPVKPDAFSDLVVGLTPTSSSSSTVADPKRQQLSSKDLFKPVDKPKTTLRDLANQSPRP